MTDTALLRITAATRRFGSVVALDGVDLEIDPGELVGVVGPSGSGKSTMLSIAAGWDDPTTGAVERGPDLRRGWSGLAVIPQGIGLIAELTALENVAIAASSGEDAGRWLTSLDLDPSQLGDRRPGQLSLGQQQRVAVARALIAHPRLVVADEPTAHQDEDNADRVMAALRHHADAGNAALVSTHDHRLVGHLDRVIEVVDGRVVPPTSVG